MLSKFACNGDKHDIALNSLIILGTLASSDNFSENLLITEGNIYLLFINILSEPNLQIKCGN